MRCNPFVQKKSIPQSPLLGCREAVQGKPCGGPKITKIGLTAPPSPPKKTLPTEEKKAPTSRAPRRCGRFLQTLVHVSSQNTHPETSGVSQHKPIAPEGSQNTPRHTHTLLSPKHSRNLHVSILHHITSHRQSQSLPPCPSPGVQGNSRIRVPKNGPLRPLSATPSKVTSTRGPK